MQNLKRASIRVMIASLIAAAGLAVVAVLVGELNDILGRALATIGLVTLHSLASLAYADSMAKSKSKSGLGFFQNTVFALIVLSFFTSVFGLWELLAGDIIGKLYMTYFVVGFASLHGSALVDTTGKESRTDNIVYTNYIFMALVVLMLLALIWLQDSVDFGDFYYRLLAAAGIVDATLTILAIIFDKLYLQKHPEQKSVLFTVQQTGTDPSGNPTQVQMAPQRRTHPLIWLLGIFIGIQIVFAIISMVMGNIASRNARNNFIEYQKINSEQRR